MLISNGNHFRQLARQAPASPVVRLARRLRQEAGDELSPTLAAALATVERAGPLTPSELAEIERVKRPTATRIVARLVEDGLVTKRDRPDRRAGLAAEREPRGQRACCSGCASARTPTWRGACASSTPRSSPRSSAPPTMLERPAGAEPRLERRGPALLRIARDPELPALLRRPADLAQRQLDADRRRDVADPDPDRQRVRGRDDDRPPVPPDAALRAPGAGCSPTGSRSARC